MRSKNSSPAISALTATERDEHGQLSDAIILELVSLGSWRVCDSRVAANRSGYVLAFVEQRNGSFEIMQLTDDFRWHGFASMRDAIAQVVETNVNLSARRRRGDNVWFG